MIIKPYVLILRNQAAMLNALAELITHIPNDPDKEIALKALFTLIDETIAACEELQEDA